MKTIVTYELYVNPETSLIVSGMHIRPHYQAPICLGFRHTGKTDPDAEEIDVPLGLYAVDPQTGSFELVGTQNFINFVALAASP